MAAASSRVFFALWPDDAVRGMLAALAREVAREALGRAPAQSNIHLTLAFLGEQASHRVEALRELASGLRAARFVLKLDEIGCFRRSGVAWLGASTHQPHLLALQANLVRALRRGAFPVDGRSYAPHLTLARKCRTTPSGLAVQRVAWEVRELALVRSALRPGGPDYRIEARWALQRPSARGL